MYLSVGASLVNEEMKHELEQWKEEALTSREELLAKTSQVKAYKKQVDQFREKLEQSQVSVFCVVNIKPYYYNRGNWLFVEARTYI